MGSSGRVRFSSSSARARVRGEKVDHGEERQAGFERRGRGHGDRGEVHDAFASFTSVSMNTENAASRPACAAAKPA